MERKRLHCREWIGESENRVVGNAKVMRKDGFMKEFKDLIEAVKQGLIEEVRSLLAAHPEWINRRDEMGATALHHAAFEGRCEVVRVLVEHGAEINARDDKFRGTPAGWAIEYLREMGAMLGIELDDFAYAIERSDVDWARRFVRRFPRLRTAVGPEGRSFKELAEESGNPEIVKLFL